MCESDVIDYRIDMSPHSFAHNRKSEWPSINKDEMDPELVRIYNLVKAQGLPNALGARLPVPSHLNLNNWDRYLDQSDDERELFSFIKYGFPLGYMGPPSDTKGISNHKSATDYLAQLDKFVEKELSLGGVMGPLHNPPFKEWCHVSPLMSREKRGTEDRRVIIDMTYPPQTSINSYIFKNTVMGEPRDHALPNVDSFVEELNKIGTGAYMSSTDVSCAYKNFRSDPLDWPLLSFYWRDKFYCDVSMPFGARASSCHMQRVATAIVRMLRDRGVIAKMYIDDLILVSPTREKVCHDLEIAQALLHDLGLPEAPDKVQPPSTKVTWLGVEIDFVSMTISVPKQKLEEIKSCVVSARKLKSMSKKHLQSVIGKVIHVAKCIRPARLFVSRLLEALRGMKKKYLKVSSEMRADLLWFEEFSSQWNGVGLISTRAPDMDVYVEASGSGIGGTDGKAAYGGQISPVGDPANNISELETVNLAVALHTFLSHQDRGRHIRVFSDNMASVEVLTTGRGRNPIIVECARSIWMISQVRVHLGLAEVSLVQINHPRVVRALEALDRDKTYVPRVKSPLEPAQLYLIISNIRLDPLGHVVKAAMLTFYFGALRQSELLPRTVKTWNPISQPTLEDIVVTTESCSIKIKTGKNMQRIGQSREVVMQRSDNPVVCPVRAMHFALYYNGGNAALDPIFTFPGTSVPLTSTKVTKTMHQVMNDVGLANIIPKVSLHSIRKSAATDAYLAGCSETSIRQYGGWTSSAYRSYISTSNTRVNRVLLDTIGNPP